MTSSAIPESSALADALLAASVVVCAGSGGVGTTSVSAALAIAAAKAGRRAVVVTIDPARRLADALGLGGLSNQPKLVEGPWAGSLHALMLDTKATFDDLVATNATDEAQRQRILGNRFYRNISNALSGTQEYMAGEKLYELHASGRFDVIVVDTPPTRNALDFLGSSNQLGRMLDHRVYRLMTAPGRGITHAWNRAAQSVIRRTARVVGAEVIDDAIAFFAAFEGLEDGFRDRSQRVRQLLGSAETVFVLVASPRADTVREALFFADQLAVHAIAVRGLVVNRLHPEFPGPVEGEALDKAGEHTALEAMYRNLADFRAVSQREREVVATLADSVEPAPVVRIPLFPRDVHDLDGMLRLASYLA